MITYCQYCNVDTGGNHELNCPNRNKEKPEPIYYGGGWGRFVIANSDLKYENDFLKKQIDKLTDFIMNEVEGEPSQSEGAIDCAIRIIKESQKRAIRLKRFWEIEEKHSEILRNELDKWIEKYQDTEKERESLADARIKDAFTIMHLNERVAELYHQYSTLRDDVLAAVSTSEAV